ncbi:MAG: alpha/beta hydrolase-fold protein [Clostridiales bacterium]|nr:alpha/beta hydrolase-fold protein [Clostridiales bacterium]
MNINYYKEYSHCLNRDMEFKVYGHAGKPCIFFPCQDGRFFDFENFQMVDYWADYIEAGKVQVFSVDTIDAETWSAKDRNPHDRIWLHEQWFHYITDELAPRIFEINSWGNGGMTASGIMTFGCSMGAMHSANFFLRRPDLFDMNLSLSGCYSSRDSFGDYMEPLIYDNSPVDFLRNMPADHPYIQMYNERKMVFCVGQGAWEDVLKESTRELDTVMAEKGIHAWFDYWGFDVDHHWYWWFKQVRHFLPYFLD